MRPKWIFFTAGIVVILFFAFSTEIKHSFVVSNNEKDISSEKHALANNAVPGTEDNLIEELLRSKLKKYQYILNDSNEYQVQIIYTQIDRDAANKPSFTQYSYGVDPKKYFYAASLVKLPCSVLALEKLNQLNVKGLDKNSIMLTDSAWACQKKIMQDTSAANKKPSVAQYIKRMLLISDNDAYGRIYELLGQEYLHKKLSEKGYPNVRIIHRFDGECNNEMNKYTNPVSFYDETGKVLYQQPLQKSSYHHIHPLGTVKKGKGYMDAKNKLVMQPKDYTYSNFLALQDINDMIKSILFPESVPVSKRFDLTKEDYVFLYKYLSMYPRESDFPRYDVKKFEDSYKKYFIYGTHHKNITQDTVRIFNIVGQSYGYLSDCAYICDLKNNTEFMLSAVIYVNKDGIINDGKYEYSTIGFPFLADLGKAFLDIERKRARQHAPDLSLYKGLR